MFKLFKKHKDLLAVVLTSFDSRRALRAYNSIKNSPKSISIDLEIVVNSLNPNYIDEVKKTFKDINVKITETKSNGHSGFGKNSIFELFRNHEINYEYLFYIDGDDFIYPTAFEKFEQMISMNPDIIGLQSHDFMLSENDYRASDFIKTTKQNNEFLHTIEHPYYLHSWNELEINMCKKFPKDIFGKIHEQYPPDRTLFLSANILKNEKDLFFLDDMSVYDDYIFCFILFERALNNNYSYAQFSNSFCYVYDRINDNALTKTFEDEKNDRAWIDKKAKSHLLPLAKKCKTFDFSIVPHFQLGPPKNFSMNDKIEFLRKNLII